MRSLTRPMGIDVKDVREWLSHDASERRVLPTIYYVKNER